MLSHWFSLLDVGSYNFSTFYLGMYILKNKKPVMDDAILNENDNLIAIIAVHTSGSNSQALAAILSQCASQSNRLATLQKKESPLGAAITVTMDTALWRSFECRKRLPLRKTLPSRSSQNSPWRKVPA